MLQTRDPDVSRVYARKFIHSYDTRWIDPGVYCDVKVNLDATTLIEMPLRSSRSAHRTRSDLVIVGGIVLTPDNAVLEVVFACQGDTIPDVTALYLYEADLTSTDA